MRGRGPRVLIAPYLLPPEAQALCKERSASYLDLEGNAHLAFGEVFIGKRSVPGRAANRAQKQTVPPPLCCTQPEAPGFRQSPCYRLTVFRGSGSAHPLDILPLTQSHHAPKKTVLVGPQLSQRPPLFPLEPKRAMRRDAKWRSDR